MVDNEEVYTTMDGERLVVRDTKRIVVPSKKNNKQIVTNKVTGRMFLINSPQHVKWYNTHRPLFDQWSRELLVKEIRLPVVRCKVKVLFYFPDSQDRDLTNKFETLADIMVDSGIIIDDTFKVMKISGLDGFVNRMRPRTEIYITIIDPSDSEYEWDLTPGAHRETLLKKKSIQKKIQRDIKKRKQMGA